MVGFLNRCGTFDSVPIEVKEILCLLTMLARPSNYLSSQINRSSNQDHSIVQLFGLIWIERLENLVRRPSCMMWQAAVEHQSLLPEQHRMGGFLQIDIPREYRRKDSFGGVAILNDEGLKRQIIIQYDKYGFV